VSRRRAPVVLLLVCLLVAGASSPGCQLNPKRAHDREAPITAESVLAHIEALPRERPVGSQGQRDTRHVLRERLEGWGLPVREQVFHWAGSPGVELVNLEVRLPGSGHAPPVLIVGAHYDAVPGSPGADDNGSGTAVVLELARRLRVHVLPVELRLVFFDAEERGLVGSRAYAGSLSGDERSRILGMINLETVGYTDRRPGSQRMPPGARMLHDPGDVGDFIFVLGTVASAPLASVVALGLEAETSSLGRVEVFSRLPGAGWVMPDSRRSDHASFWDLGLPAVMLTDTANFRNPRYHRRGDRLETLDGPFLAAVARGVERAVLLLAEDPPEAGSAAVGVEG
jgi:aminopeptidase YwaD